MKEKQTAEKSCETCRWNQEDLVDRPCNAVDCGSPTWTFWSPADGSDNLKRALRQGSTQEPVQKKRGEALRIALDVINGERQDTYGNPEDSFELISKYWNAYLIELQKKILADHGVDASKYKLVDMLSGRNVSEMMILFKVARMSGQKPALDNYADAAGYAGIAGDMVK